MLIINVDDDEDDRDMFLLAIKKIDPNIQFIGIACGEDAVEFLSRKEVSPDYIFMDINMPRMNGYECVKEIYQNINLKNTMIVMHSSTFNPRDQVDFGVLGLQYLLKTTSPGELSQSLKQILHARLLEEKH